MSRYQKSQQEVVKLAAILKNGESLPDHAESQSLATLVRTGFHAMLDLVKKQHVEIATNCLNDDAQIGQDFQDNLDQTEAAINEIVLACHNQSLADQGIDILDRPLISSFYEFDGPEYTQTVVRENDIRSIPIFLGDKTPSDVHMEQLLLHVNQVGLQLKLNEAGLISVLFKRMGGKALQVIQSQMQLLGISMDTIKFNQLVSLCEHAYMKNSTPKASKLALHQMGKLPPGSKNFMELEASIVRLTRLSCRDVQDDKEREILFRSRSLEQFLACLQPTDKALLDKQNTQRLSSGLDFLTLHASVQFLENHYRDNEINKTPLFDYGESSVNRAGMEDNYIEENNGEDQNYEQAFWVPQQRGRGRFPPPRGSFPRGGQYRGGPRNFRPGGPPQQYMPAGGAGANYPYTPRGQAPRPRFSGRGQMRGFRPNGPAQQSSGQFGRGQKTPLDKNVQYSHEKLNVADKSCFLCGVPGHRWTDSICVYHGTPLCDTPCRRCHQAGHLTKLCIGPIQAAVAALKKQKDNAKQVHTRHGHGRTQTDTDGNGVGNLNDLLDQLEMEN